MIIQSNVPFDLELIGTLEPTTEDDGLRVPETIHIAALEAVESDDIDTDHVMFTVYVALGLIEVLDEPQPADGD